MAASHTPALHRCPWIFLQMEHGLDARHFELFQPRSRSPQISSERPDLRDVVSSSRKFHPADFARRSRSRQRLVARKNARRRLAKICQPADASWLSMAFSRKKIIVHGL